MIEVSAVELLVVCLIIGLLMVIRSIYKELNVEKHKIDGNILAVKDSVDGTVSFFMQLNSDPNQILEKDTVILKVIHKK